MAKPISLGECCNNCFTALNYTSIEVPDDIQEDVSRSSTRLSLLADSEQVASLHTGEPKGFGWHRCDGCGSPFGGDRHELLAHKIRKDH